jgi:hypothetical protein
MAYWKTLFTLALVAALAVPATAQTDATELVRRADAHARGKTSQAEMTMTVVRPTWQREMSMKTWGQGNDYAMVLITAPAKEKGIVYLKRVREVWNWIPSVERTIDGADDATLLATALEPAALRQATAPLRAHLLRRLQ